MRRRNHLQPDNFPFLAVLLCAMGSLILILMELDRRARSKAHERAEQAWRQQEQEKLELLARMRTEREAERDAEKVRLERERDAAIAEHQRKVNKLRSEEVKLQADRQRVQGELESLVRALESERSREDDLKKRQQQEEKGLDRARQDLAARQQSVQEATKLVAIKRSEKARLTRDLMLIEEALARLKAQRERQNTTMSVVPYVGKRGLNRNPMYIECDAAGLLFHPDKKRMSEPFATPVSVLEEVKRRSAELQKKLAAGQKNAEPYWMLLVRPEGIGAYYLFLQAVKEQEIAYGYEFVDDPSSLPPPVEVATPLPTPKARGELLPGSPQRGGGSGNRGGTGPFPGGGSYPTGTNAATQQSLSSSAPGPLTGVPSRGSPASPPGGEREPGGEGVRAETTPAPGRMEGSGTQGRNPDQARNEGGAGGTTAEGGTPPAAATPTSQEGQPRGEQAPPQGATEPPRAVPSEGATGEPNGGGKAGGAPQFGEKGTPAPPRPRLPDMEWVLPIQCRADGVRVGPTLTTIPLAELTEGRSGVALLVRTVREQIERRRGFQRQGEPPVKIVVRFVVQKEGLRAFHLAYPLIDSFDVEKRAVLSGE
jgi:hypothetical protein